MEKVLEKVQKVLGKVKKKSERVEQNFTKINTSCPSKREK